MIDRRDVVKTLGRVIRFDHLLSSPFCVTHAVSCASSAPSERALPARAVISALTSRSRFLAYLSPTCRDEASPSLRRRRSRRAVRALHMRARSFFRVDRKLHRKLPHTRQLRVRRQSPTQCQLFDAVRHLFVDQAVPVADSRFLPFCAPPSFSSPKRCINCTVCLRTVRVLSARRTPLSSRSFKNFSPSQQRVRLFRRYSGEAGGGENSCRWAAGHCRRPAGGPVFTGGNKRGQDTRHSFLPPLFDSPYLLS